MRKAKVPLWRNPQQHVEIDPLATPGAIVGKNLFLPDGTLVTAAMLLREEAPASSYPITAWRRLLEIPPNVTALANTATTGIYVVTGPGTSATRELEVGDQLAIENPSGLGGNPRVTRTTIQHTELSPVSPWVINHNLGRRVNVEVYTLGGVRILADVMQVSVNQTIVTFDTPQAGYAVIE